VDLRAFRSVALAAGVAAAALAAPVLGQDAGQFPEEQVKQGAAIYARTCAPCHGTRMRSPEVPADLSKFPADQKNRFVTSVSNGKNQMPPWGGVLQPAEIESLWAYVMAGEK
jgi:mono/diheme cytochrome c family protein